MKIAHFTDCFFPFVNGVTVSILNYSKVLASQGHQLLIVAPRPPKKQPLPNYGPNIEFEWLPSVGVNLYPDLRLAAPTPQSFLRLRRFNPDVIHIHTNFTVGGEGIIGARLLKKPLVFTFHTYFMDKEGLKLIGINKSVGILESSLWSYTRGFCQNADVVIAPTQFVAKDLKRNQFKNRIEVLPSGLDFSRIPHDGEIKKRLKQALDLSGKMVLGVGRLSPEKNWNLLLGAMKVLFDQDHRYTLVLIGGGPAEEELRFLARVSGIDHRVRFLGRIENDQLMNEGYYLIGDVFAMPSDFETQGMVTVEAMAFGLPVVALKSKGSLSLLKNHGLLVEKSEQKFAQALHSILNNTALSKRLSQESLQRAQDFDLNNLSRQLIQIYTSIQKPTN